MTETTTRPAYLEYNAYRVGRGFAVLMRGRCSCVLRFLSLDRKDKVGPTLQHAFSRRPHGLSSRGGRISAQATFRGSARQPMADWSGGWVVDLDGPLARRAQKLSYSCYPLTARSQAIRFMTLLSELRGYDIFPVCPECGRDGTRLLVADLIEQYGEEADAGDVLSQCRCSGCGWKGIPNVTVSWTEKAPSPEQGTE